MEARHLRTNFLAHWTKSGCLHLKICGIVEVSHFSFKLLKPFFPLRRFVPAPSPHCVSDFDSSSQILKSANRQLAIGTSESELGWQGGNECQSAHDCSVVNPLKLAGRAWKWRDSFIFLSPSTPFKRFWHEMIILHLTTTATTRRLRLRRSSFSFLPLILVRVSTFKVWICTPHLQRNTKTHVSQCQAKLLSSVSGYDGGCEPRMRISNLFANYSRLQFLAEL